MEIVNGYICMNCCDVDKARLGQDPHQSTNQLQKQIEQHLGKLAAGNFGPAVTFGGSLQATNAGDGTISGNTSGNDPSADGVTAPGAAQASLNARGIGPSSSISIVV
jgi:hypothetical protein